MNANARAKKLARRLGWPLPMVRGNKKAKAYRTAWMLRIGETTYVRKPWRKPMATIVKDV